MRRLKFFGIFVVCVLIFSFLLFSFYSVHLPGESIDKDQNIGGESIDKDQNIGGGLIRFTAKDKLPVLLSDVIGLDLSKYTLIDHGYGTRYDYGDRVYVENYSVYLVVNDFI